MEIKIDIEKTLPLPSNLIDLKWSKKEECAFYTSDWKGNFYKHQGKNIFEARNFKKAFETSLGKPEDIILSFDEFDSNQIFVSTSSNLIMAYDVEKDQFIKIDKLIKSASDFIFVCEQKGLIYAFTRENQLVTFDPKSKLQKVIWTTTATINDVAFDYPYFAISLGQNDFGIIDLETFRPGDTVPIISTGFDGRALSIDIERETKRIAIGTDEGFFGSIKSLKKDKFEFYENKETSKLTLKKAMHAVEVYGISHTEEWHGKTFAFPVNSVRYFKDKTLFTGGGEGCYSMIDLEELTIERNKSESKHGPIAFMEFNKDKTLGTMVQFDDNPKNLFLPDKGFLKIFSFFDGN